MHTARDGRTAPELIGGMAPPAVVTLDIMLPHSDGYELLQRIRSRPDWVKPFKPEELRACIQRLVKA